MKFDRNSVLPNKTSVVSDDIETGTRQSSGHDDQNYTSAKTHQTRRSVMFIEDIAFGFNPTKQSVFSGGSKAHQSLRQSIADGNEAVINEMAIVTRDFALVLAMERTLFAALNNCWLVAVAGIALMTTGQDKRATQGGIGIIILAAIGVVVALYMHYVRVWQIQNDKPLRFSSTILWACWAGALSIIALVSRIYFG